MRAARPLLLAALAGACLALFVRVVAGGPVEAAVCGRVPPAEGPIPAWIYAGSALSAFVLGGVFGVWRTRAVGSDADPSPTRAGDLVLHLALVVFLAGLAVALGYETYALATPPTWPITYYIRCANLLAPGWTLLGAAAVSGLLGHWFWRPALR